MTTEHDPRTRIVLSWLREDAHENAEHVLLRALDEVDTTPQRRSWWLARRTFRMNKLALTAATAATVLVAAVAGYNLLPGPGIVGTGAAPTPSPSPSSSPAQPLDFPNLTTTFVSPTNGFSVKYFDRGEGTLTPAKDLWHPGKDQAPDLIGPNGALDPGFDVVETGLGAVFLGASMEIPDGVSIDEWVDATVVKYHGDHCMLVPRSQQAEISIDGHSGRIQVCMTDEIDATVVAGGRLYLFTLLHSRSDGGAVFDAFAATIHLTPETAVNGRAAGR